MTNIIPNNQQVIDALPKIPESAYHPAVVKAWEELVLDVMSLNDGYKEAFCSAFTKAIEWENSAHVLNAEVLVLRPLTSRRVPHTNSNHP
jgi:hypothetical protein